MDRQSLIVFFMVVFWLFTPNMVVYSAVLSAAVLADVSGITSWGEAEVHGPNGNAAVNRGGAITLAEDRF